MIVNRYWKRYLLLSGFCLATYLLFCARILLAATSSVWDGVYTNQQAARGESAYTKNCASCHGEKLDGEGQAPALAGGDFLASWNNTTLFELFDRMQNTMPADAPASLPKETTVDIAAYLLKMNKFPAGSNELAPGDALKSIRIEARRK